MRSTLLPVLGSLLCALAGCRGPRLADGAPLTVPVEARSWAGGGPAGRELLSAHYRIYTTSASPEILNHLPGFMEAAHRNYLAITGLPERPVPQRMAIYMMATREEWAALTRSIVGPQWELYANIQAGGYCHQGVSVFWDIGGVGLLAVAGHEGLHQFLHHRLTDRLPMWLEEALAAMSEGYSIDVDRQTVLFTPDHNPGRFGDLRKAIVQDWWIPLERLLPMDGGDAMQLGSPERAVGYYGQIWALGLLLRSDPTYARRSARLLADAEAGQLRQAMNLDPRRMAQLRLRGRVYNREVSVPLFRHYIENDLAAFEQRYRGFARKLARLE